MHGPYTGRVAPRSCPADKSQLPVLISEKTICRDYSKGAAMAEKQYDGLSSLASSDCVRSTLLGDAPLLRAVGFWALAASIINLTIGGGIFVLPGTLAATMGAAAPLAFVFGALVFVPVALCFSAAGSRVSSSGGPYMYVRAAFGPFSGFVIGAVFWISNSAASGGMAAALVDQASLIWPLVGHSLPRAAVILATYSMLFALNARGVRAGAVVIILLATIKLLPLLLLATLGAAHMRASNLLGPVTLNWSAIGNAMVIVIFAYSGLENALQPSGEVRNPSKVVPRATLAATAIVVGLYVGLQTVAQGVLGGALAGRPAPLAALADVIVPGAYTVLLIVASVSMFGTLQGDLLGSSRLIYALAGDGYLPAALSRVSVDRRVPLPAVATHAAAVSVLTILGSFKALVLMSGGAYCLVYFGCCAASWRLQRLDVREHGAPFVLFGGPIVPLIACLSLILILMTLAPSEWLAIGCALAAVIALAGTARWRNAVKEARAKAT
jgi:basic amino acid/polyamine antiporter, APA family